MVASAKVLVVWRGSNGKIKPEARDMTVQGKNGEWTGHKVSRYARGPQGLKSKIWILIQSNLS